MRRVVVAIVMLTVCLVWTAACQSEVAPEGAEPYPGAEVAAMPTAGSGGYPMAETTAATAAEACATAEVADRIGVTAPVSDWVPYVDTGLGFEVSIPPDWTPAVWKTGQQGVGFQPPVVGGDVQWTVLLYDGAEDTVDSIAAGIGEQFADRQETREAVTLAGVEATKVVVTSCEFKDWFSEAYLFEREDGILVVGNGAVRDSAFETFLGTLRFPQADAG